ncbi:hypothetical protein D3C80_2117540 [compost metagenome]
MTYGPAATGGGERNVGQRNADRHSSLTPALAVIVRKQHDTLLTHSYQTIACMSNVHHDCLLSAQAWQSSTLKRVDSLCTGN